MNRNMGTNVDRTWRDTDMDMDMETDTGMDMNLDRDTGMNTDMDICKPGGHRLGYGHGHKHRQ